MCNPLEIYKKQKKTKRVQKKGNENSKCKISNISNVEVAYQVFCKLRLIGNAKTAQNRISQVARLRGHSKSMSPAYHRFLPPLPPCHILSPFALIFLPSCHHPNSVRFFDPKLAKKSLGLCNGTQTNAKVAHRKATEK